MAPYASILRVAIVALLIGVVMLVIGMNMDKSSGGVGFFLIVGFLLTMFGIGGTVRALSGAAGHVVGSGRNQARDRLPHSAPTNALPPVKPSAIETIPIVPASDTGGFHKLNPITLSDSKTR